MNNIVEKDCLTFKDIEKEIFKYVCQIAVELTKKFLKEYDKKLMKERDTSKYRHKGYKDDHVRCVYGDVAYERVVYETYSDDGKKEFVFLLDETLRMDAVGKMSLNLVESIVSATSKMSFRDAAEEINRNTEAGITFQSAWNVVQKFGEKLEKEEAALIRDYEKDAIEGGKEVPVLFEEADGIFLHLQGKDRPKHMSGKEIKVSTCYEGWNEQGELVGKVMSAGFEDGKTFQKLREATIKKKYNTEEVVLRVLNGDGAGWVKSCEDPDTVFQLDRFHIYQKILGCIKDKEMQSRLRMLYDGCKTEELLETIQMYADSIATENEMDRGEKKAHELYEYLANNKEYLLSYQDREGITIPTAPEGLIYKNLGTQENQNCSNITLRMKNNKGSWSIAGGGRMAKILVRFANKSIWDDIFHYKEAVIESDREPVIWNILSAAKAPKYDGKGNKTGNVKTGHILYRDAEMTFSRKAFLKIFDNQEFTQLVYR
jgi:hypothetical protein